MKLLHEVCRDACRKYGEKIAFDSYENLLTFQDFFSRIEYLAGAMEQLEIKKGDRVAILSQNCIDYMAYHYVMSMIGAILLPLNTRLATTEMIWILNNAEASALIVDRNHEKQISELTSSCQFIKHTIGIGSVEEVDFLTNDLVNKNKRIESPPQVSIKDPVLLIYTSGTTGRPKGALQTHEGSTVIDELTAEALSISSNDAYLAIMPYFHQAGLIRTRATLIGGGTNLVVGNLNAEEMVSLIAEKNVSITLVVPPIDTLISEIADKKNISFSHLRLIIGGGGMGPIHAERMRQFCKKYKCQYMGIYGQTEVTGPATIVMGNDYFKNPATCGKPMKGIDLEIWDDENSPAPIGTVGEIMIRSRTTIPGYFRNDQANKELYTNEWLHTGDLARVDEEGFVYFVSRKKELIKSGGENVYPREVESILEKHPDIADLAIIGIPDTTGWGEKVTAVIVTKSNRKVELEDIRNFCRNKIAGYKIPKQIEIVDEIPRNASGKILKMKLRDKFLK